MKLSFELEVTSCRTCLFMELFYPSKGEGSDLVCTKANYKVIAENIIYEEEPNIDIPHWCSLN